MQTTWYIIATKEGLQQAIPDATQAGDPPYLLIDLNSNVVVFDLHAMLGMIAGFNDAVEQQLKVIEEQRVAQPPQEEGADG